MTDDYESRLRARLGALERAVPVARETAENGEPMRRGTRARSALPVGSLIAAALVVAVVIGVAPHLAPAGGGGASSPASAASSSGSHGTTGSIGTGSVGTGSFTTTGSLVQAQMFAEATLLNDGTVLITGGADISTSSTNVETWTPRAPELYDPPTGAFRTTGSMVTARVGTTATLLPNGRVLVTGGVDDRGTTLSSAELYDPKTGEFSVTGSMAGARAGHTATRLKDGRVLVAGGVADSSETPARTSAEVYDPTTGRFTSAGTMVTMRELHTATLLADGRVLIAGGVTSQVRPLESDPATYGTVAGDSSGSSWIPADTAELYDPASGTFSPTGSLRILSSERFVGHTATLLADGRVLLMGSMSLPAELYDPQSGAFSESGPSTNTWTQATVTPLPSGLVLIAGGFDVHEGGVAGAELYDPKTDTYSPTVPMATPRYGAAAALLPDGRVLILGGRSDNVGPSVMLDSAELYTPAGTRQ